jgi:predicted RNA-binding protein YlqC (UPF0109 family)
MSVDSEVDNQSDSDEFIEDEESEDSANRMDESQPVPTTEVTADLEELVRFVATKLVQNPDDVVVESELRAGTVYVSLRVPEEEMGRVIGREGRTAKAIRTLVSIAGSRHNVHARLDIDG